MLPTKSATEQARTAARRVFGLEALRRKVKAGSVSVSAEQKDELDEKLKEAARDLQTSCRSVYTVVLLPIKSPKKSDEGEPIAWKTVELGAFAATGDNGHSQLLELLKRQIYPELTPDRFLELVGIAPGGKPFAQLGDALDAFFAFVERPKVRSDHVLLAAVVAAIESKKIGYVSSGRVDGEKLVVDAPVGVRFGLHHTPDELEDGGFLLAAEHARELEEARRPGGGDKGGDGGAGPSGGNGGSGGGGGGGPDDGSGGGDGGTGGSGKLPPPAKKGTKATQFFLETTVSDKKSWNTLVTALHEAVGLSSGVKIHVRLEAKQAAGFDAVAIRNKVKEPLEEKGLDFVERLSE